MQFDNTHQKNIQNHGESVAGLRENMFALSGRRKVCDPQDGAYHIQSFRPLPQGVIWFRHLLLPTMPYPSSRPLEDTNCTSTGCDL
jgi:hypothetical protein